MRLRSRLTLSGCRITDGLLHRCLLGLSNRLLLLLLLLSTLSELMLLGLLLVHLRLLLLLMGLLCLYSLVVS